MTVSAFALGEQIKLQTLGYVLHKPLWDSFAAPPVDISFVKWEIIKYLNDDGTDFNSEIKKVPNKKGGLYMFFIRCNIISGITEYPFYIGRAQLTSNQNLRKRVREYFTTFARNGERPKITKMISYWGKQLYLAYYELDDNSSIVDIEKNLINSLLLPMNDQIPDTEVRASVKAF